MSHLKENLLDLLSYTYAHEKAFGADLTDFEQNAKGVLEHWTIKDNLAHIAAWQNSQASNLEAVQRGETPERSEDFNLTNAAIFAAHQDDPWDKVQLDLEQAFRRLSAQVELLSDEDLTRSDFFPWLNGRPLWRIIAGNGAIHPFSHITSYLAQNGQPAEAVAMFESATPRMKALMDDESWQGMIEYDLACTLALSGERDKAIAALHLALTLTPTLLEWSKEDTDLDSLRQEPAFQTLYAS